MEEQLLSKLDKNLVKVFENCTAITLEWLLLWLLVLILPQGRAAILKTW